MRDAGRGGFETSQKSKFPVFTRESIDHGVFIVKASELPNQVVVDAFACTVVEGSKPRVERPESRLGC